MYNAGGNVDTLNLLFDKLDGLFSESQDYYETFLDTNNLYKQGKMSDKEFFQKLGDYVVAYSALEFLSIKVLFEIRKRLDGNSVTSSPGLMPGMGPSGSTGMAGAGVMMPPRAGTPANPVGGPPGIVSAKEAFGEAGTLPTPDPALMPKRTTTMPQNACAACGVELRPNAKFCTKCGNKI